MTERDKAFDHKVGESLHWEVPPPEYAQRREQSGKISPIVDVIVLGSEAVQAGVIAVGERLTGRTLYESGVETYRVNLKKKPDPKHSSDS